MEKVNQSCEHELHSTCQGLSNNRTGHDVECSKCISNSELSSHDQLVN